MDFTGSTERIDGLVDSFSDISKLSALQSCILAKYGSVAKHFNSGIIGLFRLVGDVIASLTNSTFNPFTVHPMSF